MFIFNPSILSLTIYGSRGKSIKPITNMKQPMDKYAFLYKAISALS